MKKIENLLKILKASSNFMQELNVSKSGISELDTLIKAIECNENLEFKKLIDSIEKIDSNNHIKVNKDIYEIGDILKKLSSNKQITIEEKNIIEKFNDKDIRRYLDMSEEEFIDIITNNSNTIKSMDSLKLILYLKYNMTFKGKKTKKTILNEACYLISQKRYYENMENAYKNQIKNNIEFNL